MSRRVTTRTPIIDRECLIEALNSLNCQYSVRGNDIEVRVNYYTITYSKKNTHYSVNYYSDHYDERQLVDSIESVYLQCYKAKIERLERERIEEELRREREKLEAYKQAQKEQIIAKAQKQGYKVKEVKKGDKIQLVCVRYS